MSSSETIAAPAVLMLAAGRGRRLGPDAPERPKVLMSFGGRTLLERHLERLQQAGAGPVHLVVGYERQQIEAALEALGRTDVVLIDNPDWREGSVVSLHAGSAVLRSGRPVVLMDADVIYDQRLMDRLLASRLPATLLLDPELEPGDEPVKICLARDGSGVERIVDFAKRPDAAHDWHGESVGFFRFEPDVAEALAAEAARVVEAGDRATEYEEPIRSLIRADAASGAAPRFGYVGVAGLPWTEIDFTEDVAKAERLVPLLTELPA